MRILHIHQVSKLSLGDNVRLTDNIDALKKMQEGHGGYDDGMEKVRRIYTASSV